jgi:hypothetical protein
MEKRVMIVGGNEGRGMAGMMSRVIAAAGLLMVDMGFHRRGSSHPIQAAPANYYAPARRRHNRHQGYHECNRRLSQIEAGTHGADFMMYRACGMA